jgi:trans-aconitate methyltransferase
MADEPQPIDTEEIHVLTRRLAEDASLWPTVKEGVRATFDPIAHDWETRLDADHVVPLDAALTRAPAPRRALDLGTGTGLGARLVAERYPEAIVAGLDLSQEMIRQARSRDPEGRIGFLTGDSVALPFRDGAFDLITAISAFVFWDELTRVLVPGGSLAITYAKGEDTPIYLPAEDVRRHLAAAGDYEVEDGRAGSGTWVLARKR